MSNTLPEKYAYLGTLGVLPKGIQEGMKLLGVREIKGPENNPVIMQMAKELGISDIYTSDDTQAWCGLSHGCTLKRAQYELFLTSYDLLRALSYLKFGNGILSPGLGDTLVFKRPQGGHVGYYVGETMNTYHVMGGNQSDMYGFTEIEKSRLVGARRPKYHVQPETVRKIMLTSSGHVSVNEQ
jgi:uncharacterized protein (TIGR02594 family)